MTTLLLCTFPAVTGSVVHWEREALVNGREGNKCTTALPSGFLHQGLGKAIQMWKSALQLLHTHTAHRARQPQTTDQNQEANPNSAASSISRQIHAPDLSRAPPVTAALLRTLTSPHLI